MTKIYTKEGKEERHLYKKWERDRNREKKTWIIKA